MDIKVSSGGESCVTHYFLGKYGAKKWLQGKKCAVYEVSYPEKSDMRVSIVSDIKLNIIVRSPQHNAEANKYLNQMVKIQNLISKRW